MDKDRFLICASCHTRFLWTAYEQKTAAEPPAHCPGCQALLPAAGRQRGVVKFYNKRQGWGFITPIAGQEIFFHRSGLAEGVTLPLNEGELVEFAVQATDRGPQAVQVTRLDG